MIFPKNILPFCDYINLLNYITDIIYVMLEITAVIRVYVIPNDIIKHCRTRWHVL